MNTRRAIAWMDCACYLKENHERIVATPGTNFSFKMPSEDPTDPIQSATGVPHHDGHRKPSLVPKRVGRYRIDRLLGEGGFGVVYLRRTNNSIAPSR